MLLSLTLDSYIGYHMCIFPHPVSTTTKNNTNTVSPDGRPITQFPLQMGESDLNPAMVLSTEY